MGKVITVDVSRCSGCMNCQLACKDEHCGNTWLPYSQAQPEIGQFWLKVQEHTCGSVPKVRMHYIPTLCNHCKNAPCIKHAENGAVYRRDDGLIIIDPEKAVGQKSLVDACPYGVIYWNEEMKLPQKCTGCAHLLDNGYALPRCVEACPTDALQFGEEEDLMDFIEGAKVLQPELGAGPRVFYRNIPGQFIAGTVYDPIEEEVIKGAEVRLNNYGKLWKTVTDNYGDFWFNDLDVGVYDLVIEAKGYKFKTFEKIRTRESVNLGDIALEADK